MSLQYWLKVDWMQKCLTEVNSRHDVAESYQALITQAGQIWRSFLFYSGRDYFQQPMPHTFCFIISLVFLGLQSFLHRPPETLHYRWATWLWSCQTVDQPLCYTGSVFSLTPAHTCRVAPDCVRSYLGFIVHRSWTIRSCKIPPVWMCFPLVVWFEICWNDSLCKFSQFFSCLLVVWLLLNGFDMTILTWPISVSFFLCPHLVAKSEGKSGSSHDPHSLLLIDTSKPIQIHMFFPQ